MSEYENKINSVRKLLINWYKKNGRDFPWRHTKNPYKIMIAEFMLHRTKAEQVVPVYKKFMRRYPHIISLSQARKEEINKFTEHIGLHWRSEHFIKSARYILKKYNGRFPEDYNELTRIPGIGEYIAGVIMTVCYDKPAPVVDSNIARFVNRYFNLNLEGEIRRKKAIIEISYDLFKLKNLGMFLFAIIDFTSTICKPRIPVCQNCPLKIGCENAEYMLYRDNITRPKHWQKIRKVKYKCRLKSAK